MSEAMEPWTGLGIPGGRPSSFFIVRVLRVVESSMQTKHLQERCSTGKETRSNANWKMRRRATEMRMPNGSYAELYQPGQSARQQAGA